MTVAELSSLEDLEAKVKGERSVVVYLYGDSSTLCTNLSPKFDAVSNINPNVDFYKIDVAVKGAKTHLKVGEIPAFVLFKGGNRSGAVVGNSASLNSIRDLVGKA